MKIPVRFRRLPKAFQRNPKLVTKFFLSILFRRIITIVFYISAILILSFIAPRTVAMLIKNPTKIFSLMQKVSLTTIVKLAREMPSDISKFLNHFSEFFHRYGKRFLKFNLLLIRDPFAAIDSMSRFCQENVKLLSRIGKSASAFLFSLLLVKFAMIFIVPLISGVAVTIAGIRLSMILIFAVKFVFDKIGNVIGKLLYRLAKSTFAKKEINSEIVQ